MHVLHKLQFHGCFTWLNEWHVLFLLLKKIIYFSCSTLTASSYITWLHALSAEATAVVLGGKERAPVVIWRSTTTQKVVLTPEGRAAGNG